MTLALRPAKLKTITQPNAEKNGKFLALYTKIIDTAKPPKRENSSPIWGRKEKFSIGRISIRATRTIMSKEINSDFETAFLFVFVP
jgi:hypothetical protein